MSERVSKIFSAIENPPEAIVFVNGVDPHLDLTFFYVTDLVGGGLFERSAAILFPNRKPIVLTSRLEEPSARKGNVEVLVYETPSERGELLLSALSGVHRVGIHPPELTLQDYEFLRSTLSGVEFVDVSKGVQRARLVKDPLELQRIERACRIASDVAREIPTLLSEGMTELELQAEIDYLLQKKGSSGSAFSTIVAFGENASEPHYSSGSRRLRKGDWVLCDFGAKVEHYVSDITRTFVFGKATSSMRRVYETVLSAQRVGLSSIRSGVKGGEVHVAVSSHIDSTPYRGRFTHSTGHSLGLAIHDGPPLHPRVDLTLEKGMVFTVEPGIYLPGVGGVRIEDDVVVTEEGCRILTDAPRDLLEIDRGA